MSDSHPTDDFPLFTAAAPAEPTPPRGRPGGRRKSPAAPAEAAADAAPAAPAAPAEAAAAAPAVAAADAAPQGGRRKRGRGAKSAARDEGPAPVVIAGPSLLRTKLGVLHHGCGLTWLEACPPGTVDLVVADPPYNMGKAAWDRLGSLEEYLTWTRRWVDAAQRALAPEGSLYVCGWSEVLAHVQVAVASSWHSVRWLVWFYRNKANLKDDWGRSHESILHLRKGRTFTFETDAVRIPYNGHTTRYPERTQAETSQYGGARKDTWKPHPLGARPRDVIEVPVLANGTIEKTSHPTQKPVQLIRKLVLASSRPGDLVVDPFCGSGTTALVAETHGRRWVTCELDPGYAAIAAKRIADPAAHAGLQTSESEAELAARRGRLR